MFFKSLLNRGSTNREGEERFLLPSKAAVPVVEHAVQSSDRSGLSALLPADVASVVTGFLDPRTFEGQRGVTAIAAQYPNNLGYQNLKAALLAQNNFDSVVKVLSYLLKYHPQFEESGVEFRYIKVFQSYYLFIPRQNDGGYTIDIATQHEYAALKVAFKHHTFSAVYYFIGMMGCAALTISCALLFAYLERSLLFCPFFIQNDRSFSSDEQCQGKGIPNDVFGCDDFPPPLPAICGMEQSYCPMASFLNSSWILMENSTTAVSCSETDQVLCVLGMTLFSIAALCTLAAYLYNYANYEPAPRVIEDNWSNVQAYFKGDTAPFSVSPVKINPDEIEVAFR